MAATTFNNDEAIAHNKSDGKGLSPLDVCQTPAGTSTVPIPYPNLCKLEDLDTSTAPKTVTFDGGIPFVFGSKIPQSKGDEPGCAGGGIMSGSNCDEAEFLLFSFDTIVEGKPVCRNGDIMWFNKKNTIG